MKRIFSFLFAGLVFAVAVVWAEAPNLITYQGRLKESNLPVTGNRSIEIVFCDALTGGTCYPTPGVSAQSVTVSNGLFKSTVTVPVGVDLSAGPWYLAVYVGGTELTPREQFTSVPYALYAATAAYSTGLTAAAGAAGVTASTNVFITGNLGIGTTGPGADLHLYSTTATDNKPQLILQNYIGGRYLPSILFKADDGFDGTPASNNASRIVGGFEGGPNWSDTIIGFETTQTGLSLIRAMTIKNGNVGIGTITPAYRLDVSSGAGEAGRIFAVSTGATNVFYVAGDGAHALKYYGDGSALTGVTASGAVSKTGDTMTGSLALLNASTLTVTGNAFSVGGSTFVVTGGNVGIGTTGPVSRLEVVGGSITISGSDANLVVGGNASRYVYDDSASFRTAFSSNVYIVGYSSAARYYGDGSALTGITASGYSGVLPAANGGTGLANIAQDNILYASAADTFAAAPISVFGRSLIDDANAGAALATLGAAAAADVAADTDTLRTDVDLKAPLADPTFTGTVSGITKAMVGLTNVDDTSDAGKPVSTAQQAALDLKAVAADVSADTDTLKGLVDIKVSSALASGNIFVGSAAGEAAGVVMSGDAAISNTGALTIANDAVTTAKILAANVTAPKLAADVAGLGISSNTGTGALDVNVDNSSLELSGDLLQVKALGVTNAMLDSSIDAVKLGPSG